MAPQKPLPAKSGDSYDRSLIPALCPAPGTRARLRSRSQPIRALVRRTVIAIAFTSHQSLARSGSFTIAGAHQIGYFQFLNMLLAYITDERRPSHAAGCFQYLCNRAGRYTLPLCTPRAKAFAFMVILVSVALDAARAAPLCYWILYPAGSNKRTGSGLYDRIPKKSNLLKDTFSKCDFESCWKRRQHQDRTSTVLVPCAVFALLYSH